MSPSAQLGWRQLRSCFHSAAAWNIMLLLLCVRCSDLQADVIQLSQDTYLSYLLPSPFPPPTPSLSMSTLINLVALITAALNHSLRIKDQKVISVEPHPSGDLCSPMTKAHQRFRLKCLCLETASVAHGTQPTGSLSAFRRLSLPTKEWAAPRGNNWPI